MQRVLFKQPNSHLTAEEARWITPKAIHLAASNVSASHTLYLLAVSFLFAILYSFTNFYSWLIWVGAHLILIALRVYHMNAYMALARTQNLDIAARYYNKHLYVIALGGLLWGCTAYLSLYEHRTLPISICMLVVMAYAYSATISFSAHFKTLSTFFYSFGIGLLTSLSLTVVLRAPHVLNFTNVSLIIGYLILLTTMKSQGMHLYLTYTNAMLLQFKNLQLIASLTVEKKSAIDAVTDKNRLIASTAHDMRQPVLALDLYSQMLSEDISLAAELTPKIHAATQGVISLFDSMFELAQIKEDQVKINLTEINILSVMQDLSHQYQTIANNKGLLLRTRFVDQQIKTDLLLFKRIVSNLVSNAIKYSQSGGILIACRLKKKSLFVEVWDTGSGIAEEEQGLIFHEFYKSPTHAGTNDGFGLGLSIVKQFAEKLGYTLHMKSRLGMGTMMAVEIPLLPSATR